VLSFPDILVKERLLMNFPYKNKKVLYGISAFLIVFIFFGIYSVMLLKSKVFYKGISVGNVSLAALSQDEAVKKVTEYSGNINESGAVSFSYNGQIYYFNVKNISFSYQNEKTVKDAFQIGRTGNILGRLFEIRKIRSNGENVTLQYSYDRVKLVKMLTQLQAKINVPEKGARMYYKNGKFSLQNEVAGLKLNIEKTIEQFDKCVYEGDFDEIPIVVEEVLPTALVENIQSIDAVISTATTSFSTGDVNRSYNIKHAAETLDGMVIMPGETFSMNSALGPRTIENGYRDAKVILADELVDGPGGGVCQVTTTLYVAVLKAMLNVTERMHHSFTLGYVPPGQDATIADGYIDFKFTNDKDYPVCINAEVSGGNINIRILSKKMNQYTVKLRSEILEVTDPEPEEMIKDKTLEPGQIQVVKEAKQGKRVQVFREIYDKNGVLIEKTKVTDDIYRPIRGQIRIN
jgi:Uncharacterized vancomycin resistance protein